MNEQEQQTIISMIEERNGKPMSTIDAVALQRRLPDMTFDEVFDRLTRHAETERWLTASHALHEPGATDKTTSASKFAAADAAWSNISRLASESDGMMGLIANIDSVKWEDDTARKALLETRQTIKTQPEKKALWEFRDTYNRLQVAEDKPEQVTAQLPTGYEPPTLRAVPERDSRPLNVSQLVAEMKSNLAQIPGDG